MRPACPDIVACFRQMLAALKEQPAADRYGYACAVGVAAIEAYWNHLLSRHGSSWKLTPPVLDKPLPRLEAGARKAAGEVGLLAASSDPLFASYLIGELYTALLPDDLRARHGIFYTPPALADRLLTLASQAGADWSTAKVLDPACGGGAFLTPVAIKIVASLRTRDASALLDHIASHLRGFEIDPVGAWMSQAFVEAALLEPCLRAGRRLPPLVTMGDALTMSPDSSVDLVIGNPPYGRVTLSPRLREVYKRSLYGHANIYGLFMDLGVRWTRPGGVLAYITPTGFLGGQYFKELRSLMSREAPPAGVDLVRSRKNVFSGVLQETLLAVYRRAAKPGPAAVHILALDSEGKVEVSPAGSFSLPRVPTEPWLVPRDLEQTSLIESVREMPHRLADYGYKVSTGPLVWNRHKPQLSDNLSRNSYPILWAECIAGNGRFEHRAEKLTHKPFLRLKSGQDWLLTQYPCVLLQRTTAKEQSRRLIAAVLPARLIREYGAVVVENHLNIVKPFKKSPPVSLRVLAELLNSETVDSVFRCINGSVAVSATELESLPLPPPEALQGLEALLDRKAPSEEIQGYIRSLYSRRLEANAAA
ncbi:MAG TPA: Eco57I restriction-modification methylase domain-containing protein [Thermoanaerobaculia bacterium]